MQVTRQTTAEEFIQRSGWEMGAGSPLEFQKAFRFFLDRVPLDVLNRADASSPWGPPGTRRTTLLSWLQAIDFTRPVNPARLITQNEWVKQVRFPDEPLQAKGDWFTWLWSGVDRMGLPEGQTADRIYRVARPITCLEARIADAFAGWVEVSANRDYRHGGAVQLFIYRNGPEASALQLMGGAKPR